MERDSVFHMDMLEALRRERAELLYVGEDGVLLIEKRSGAYMLSVSTEDAGKRLVGLVKDAKLFLAHQSFCIPILIGRFGYQHYYDCLQAAY